MVIYEGYNTARVKPGLMPEGQKAEELRK